MRRILARNDRRPYVVRLRPHQILGYLVAAAASVHAFAAMFAGGAGASAALGIDAATIALLAAIAQVLLGLLLVDPGAYRTPLRRWHRFAAWTIAAATIIHVAVNAPFVFALVSP